MIAPAQVVEMTPEEIAATKRFALLERLRNKEETLSFSSFRKFAESPNNFMRYKMRTFKQTDAMIFGSLVDCLLLTEEEYEKQFIISTDKPSTEIASQYCEYVLEGIDPEQAFLLAGYSPKSKPTKTIDKYQPYIDIVKSGKMIISQADYELARKMVTTIQYNKPAKWLLNQTTETQAKKNWEFGGFKWRGLIDMKGEEIKCDLKIMPDSNPRKVRYKIREMRYHWQGAMYTGNDKTDFYFIVADRNCNVSVHHLPRAEMEAAWQDMEYYMQRFKRCIYENAWDASWDYFAPSGIYKLSI